jgi:hypothetical protein
MKIPSSSMPMSQWCTWRLSFGWGVGSPLGWVWQRIRPGTCADDGGTEDLVGALIAADLLDELALGIQQQDAHLV